MKLKLLLIPILFMGLGINNSEAQVKKALQPQSADAMFADKPSFFPLAVWLQSTTRAAEYKAIGVNMYVGIWEGLNSRNFSDYQDMGIPVMGHVRDGQEYIYDLPAEEKEFIYAWTNPLDEPDNPKADKDGNWTVYTSPDDVVEQYENMKAIAHDGKPIFLGLGSGVSDINWVGRGDNTGKWEMYPEKDNGYCAGGDIIHYDIYPANSNYGQLGWVAKGVDSLVSWNTPGKPVMIAMEATRFNGDNRDSRRPTVKEVRSEIWQAIIHGARGIVYFSHVLAPKFNEAGILADAEMMAALTVINKDITDLASVINSPNLNFSTVESTSPFRPIDISCKTQGEYHYIFAAEMKSGNTTGYFTLPDAVETVEVVGENRTIDIVDGGFTDQFSDYGVHLYKLHRTDYVLEEIEDEFVSNDDLSIYPNPTTGVVNIKVGDKETKVNKVEVYSTQGQLIDIFINKSQINLTYGKKGIYILKIYTDNSVNTTKVSIN